MIYLTDEIALTADSIQYIVGKPVQRPGKGVEMQNPKYYHKLSAALQQAVTDCVRAGVADNRITELRQIVTEQARLEQEFSEKLKGVMYDGPLCYRPRAAVDRCRAELLCPASGQRCQPCRTGPGRRTGRRSRSLLPMTPTAPAGWMRADRYAFSSRA